MLYVINYNNLCTVSPHSTYAKYDNDQPFEILGTKNPMHLFSSWKSIGLKQY